MKKRSVLVLLSILAFIVAQCFFVSADSSVFVSGSEEYTEAGSVVTVDVSISNNIGISSYLLEIDYDHNTFLLERVDFNNNFAPDGYKVINGDYIMWGNENTNNDEGVLRPYDTMYNGVMFSLTFSVAQNAAPGAYPVKIALGGNDDWNFSDSDAEPVPVSFTQGMIYIGVEDIYLLEEPTKKDYFVGNEFTSEGGIIRVEYYDGNYEDIIVTEDMCSGYDMNTPGKQTVTITYLENEFTYEINVAVPVVTDVYLLEEPEKKEYFVGEDFTSKGGIIRVEYSDGSHVDVPVTEDMCTGYDMNTEGRQTVTITYDGYEFTYEILVKIPVIVDAELVEEPDKKDYFVGEEFDPNGGVIKVEYSDGTIIEVPVTEDMCTGYDPETPGKQTITITYKDFEFTYEIEVKVPEIVDADLIKEPNKKEYEKGEEFDPDGGVIRVEYSDGTIIEVPVTEDMCTGYDPEKPGKQTITITYEGFEFTYEIIVDTPFVPETGDNDNIFYLLLAIAIAGGFVLQTKILKKKCYEV